MPSATDVHGRAPASGERRGASRCSSAPGVPASSDAAAVSSAVLLPERSGPAIRKWSAPRSGPTAPRASAPMPRIAASGPAGRRQLGPRDVRGQRPDGWRDVAREGRAGLPRERVDRRLLGLGGAPEQRDLHRRPVAGEAAPGRQVGARGGAPRDPQGGVVVVVGHAQHDPLRHHAGQAAGHARAPVRRRDDVDPERAALRGELLERREVLPEADPLERAREGRVAVEQHDDARHARPGDAAGAELGDAGGAVLAEQPPPLLGEAPEAVEQPLRALLLAARDDRAALRQRLQRAQAAAGVVERVEMQVLRPVPPGERDGERAQQRRLAAAARAEDEQAAVGVEVERERHLGAPLRLVAEPEDGRPGGTGVGQRREVDERRERRQPGRRGPLDPQLARRRRGRRRRSPAGRSARACRSRRAGAPPRRACRPACARPRAPCRPRTRASARSGTPTGTARARAGRRGRARPSRSRGPAARRGWPRRRGPR